MANSSGARPQAVTTSASTATTRRSAVSIRGMVAGRLSPARASAPGIAANEVERLSDLPEKGDRTRNDRGYDFELVSRRPAEPHHSDQQHDQQDRDHSRTPPSRASH